MQEHVGSNKVNLLVVDDEEANNDLVCRVFHRTKYVVTVADSGLRALSLLDQQSVDVVVVDFSMPSMNGLEFVEQAREKVAELEAEKEGLEAEKEYYQTAEFVEEEARNRLNMSRPGEAVVVMPEQSSETVEARVLADSEPIWRQWVEYFGFK